MGIDEIDIDNLSEDDLMQLNERIVARLQFLESLHAHKEMLRFKIGQKVSFQSPNRERQVGTLVKYNKKTVTVLTDSGQRWNVSPHLLSAVKGVKSKGFQDAEVIDVESKK